LKSLHLHIKTLSLYLRFALIPPHTESGQLKPCISLNNIGLCPGFPPHPHTCLYSRNTQLTPSVMSQSCHDGVFCLAISMNLEPLNTWATVPPDSIFSPRRGSTYLFTNKLDLKAISGVFRVCGYPFSNKLDLKAVSGCFSHIETGRAISQHVDHKLNRRNTCCMCKKCAKKEVYPPVGASKEPYANEINAIYGALSWDLGRRMFADRGLTYMPRLCCGLSWTCEG
jgi:hypothetical protein